MVAEDVQTAGQLVMASWPSGGLDDLERAIGEMPVGGFELHRSDILEPHTMRRTLERLWTLYSEHNLPPPFVAVTEEGGTVGRFSHYPPGPSARAMAQGAVETVFRLGSLTGTVLASQGFNWCFGPVLDVLTEPRNPVIGTRSFGNDGAVVARYATAWLKGLRQHGVLATGKHFPGHGMTTRDSHVERPVVALDQSALQQSLAPYAAAIAAGMDAVMTAHVRYEDCDDQIATLSAYWLHEVLRRRLDFQGLVVSDGLGMKGIAMEGRPQELASRAVKAGIDVLAVGGDWEDARDWIEGLYRALPNDATLRGRVHESHQRIRTVKARLPRPSEWPTVPSWDSVQHGYDEVLGPLLRELQGRLSCARVSPRPFVMWAGRGPSVEVEEDGGRQGSSTDGVPQDRSAPEAGPDGGSMSQAAVLITDNLWKSPQQRDAARHFCANAYTLHIVVADPIDAEEVPADERVHLFGNRHLLNRAGLESPAIRRAKS